MKIISISFRKEQGGSHTQSLVLLLRCVKRCKIALTNNGEQHVVEKQRHEHDK